jgi:phage terminase large subunit-like protein
VSGERRRLRPWLVAAGRQLDDTALRRTLASLSPGERMTVHEDWPIWAHGGQEEPEGDWRVWAIRAGRGFGKTRAGAEWVLARAREHPEAQIALIAATLDEAVKVMVKGESGLIASARADEDLRWVASERMLLFPSGARAFAYSAHSPDSLRGPQHHFAWCDELAKWAKAEETWDNLMLGLRLGERPRTMVTTTPRPIPLLRRIEALERAEVTRGRTVDNPHVARDFRDAVTGMYRGTRLGRQELDGELIEEIEGALWTRAMVEQGRSTAPDELVRVVIGVDPPASAAGDECGIVVCGLDREGTGWVLADRSKGGLSPEGWAQRVARAAEDWSADKVIVETNQGGEMVTATLRGADCALPVRPATARFGKGKRAEPVAQRFETGKARFAGRFPELEDQLCALTAGGGYAGPGRSPDRADAMVWALAELMLGPKRDPRIRRI